MVGALQERLVAVKKEKVDKSATRHSELRASVDAKVKAAVSTLAAFSPSPLAPLWPSSAGTPIATDRRAPPRRRWRAPSVGSPAGRARRSFGCLPRVRASGPRRLTLFRRARMGRGWERKGGRED